MLFFFQYTIEKTFFKVSLMGKGEKIIIDLWVFDSLMIPVLSQWKTSNKVFLWLEMHMCNWFKHERFLDLERMFDSWPLIIHHNQTSMIWCVRKHSTSFHQLGVLLSFMPTPIVPIHQIFKADVLRVPLAIVPKQIVKVGCESPCLTLRVMWQMHTSNWFSGTKQ